MPSSSIPNPLQDAVRYSIETVRTEPELDNLEADWNRLSESATRPNVFTTYGWFRAWMKHRIQEEGQSHLQPNVFVLRQNGSVMGISPFVRRYQSRFGVSLQKLSFVTNYADYSDLVLGGNPIAMMEAVVDHLKGATEEWDFADFRDLRDGENTIAHMRKALIRAGLPHRFFSEELRCPYMPIDGPWSEIESRHSRFTRRTLRRFAEKARDGFRIRIVENPQDEPGLLGKMIALEAQKHVKGEQSPPFLGVYPEVFQGLFDSLGPRRRILVVLLELEERLVAFHFLFRSGKKLWGYSTAYDHRFSDISPGTALIPAIVDYGFSHGFDEFDFLRGEEPYKMRWTSGYHSTCRLVVWNRRWKSRLAASAYLKTRVNASEAAKSALELEDVEAAAVE